MSKPTEPVATLPAESLNARCRSVWVCKRCGNCEIHCKHGDESNFHEDLIMPCSVRVSAPEAGGEPSDVISREAAVRAVSTFCDRFETLGDRFKKQLRNTVRALPAIQPAPTPADEETVLRMISDSLSLDSLEVLPARELKVLQDRITTALAEARRAGTPTTDARELVQEYKRRNNKRRDEDKPELREAVDDIYRPLGYIEVAALPSTPSEQKEKE